VRRSLPVPVYETSCSSWIVSWVDVFERSLGFFFGFSRCFGFSQNGPPFVPPRGPLGLPIYLSFASGGPYFLPPHALEGFFGLGPARSPLPDIAFVGAFSLSFRFFVDFLGFFTVDFSCLFRFLRAPRPSAFSPLLVQPPHLPRVC